MKEPEYDYFEERNLSGEVVASMAVCRHVNLEKVRALLTEEVVAEICLDCPMTFYVSRN